MQKNRTPKIKFLLNESERKFHILTAFKLYNTEMYLAQKATEVAKMKCSKCKTILERKVSELLEDYETKQSISVLFETVAVFEPEMYDRIKKEALPDALGVVIAYLTGDDVKKENVGVEGVVRKINPAIQAKDILDKKNIIVTKQIPKNIGKGKGKK